MKDAEFKQSNSMLMAVLKKQKNEGLDKTKHYPTISRNDLEIILSPDSFDLEDPTELQQKVFFDIQLNFARRGRENIQSLKKSASNFAKDDVGNE